VESQHPWAHKMATCSYFWKCETCFGELRVHVLLPLLFRSCTHLNPHLKPTKQWVHDTTHTYLIISYLPTTHTLTNVFQTCSSTTSFHVSNFCVFLLRLQHYTPPLLLPLYNTMPWHFLSFVLSLIMLL